MSLLSRLFGGKANTSNDAPSEAAVEEHNGFKIYVGPQKDSGGYRVAARIEKEIAGEAKAHQMIRADVCQTLEEAERTSLLKAKILIDQQGDDIFR